MSKGENQVSALNPDAYPLIVTTLFLSLFREYY